MNVCISIPTGTYTKDAALILRSAINSMRFSHQVPYYFRKYGAAALDVVCAPNGEVCFEVVLDEYGWDKIDRFWKNRRLRKSFCSKQPIASEVEAVKKMIGWQIKNVAKDILERQNYTLTGDANRKQAKKDWNRQSNVVIYQVHDVKNKNEPDITATISDLYFLHEKLIGRLEMNLKKYNSAVVRRFIG